MEKKEEKKGGGSNHERRNLADVYRTVGEQERERDWYTSCSTKINGRPLRTREKFLVRSAQRPENEAF